MIKVAAVPARSRNGYALIEINNDKPVGENLGDTSTGEEFVYSSALRAKKGAEQNGWTFLGFWNGTRILSVKTSNLCGVCAVACPAKNLVKMLLP